MTERAKDLVDRAIAFATRAHLGQMRKGTALPYIEHPLAVGRILADCGQPAAVVAAGVLHDTIEDTAVTRAELERHFGPRVAELVAAVSEPDRSVSWEERKRHTIATVRSAPLPVVWIELADKLDNIRAIAADGHRLGGAIWQRFSRPEPDQRWYYRGLARAFAERMTDGVGQMLAAEIGRTVEAVFGPGEMP